MRLARILVVFIAAMALAGPAHADPIDVRQFSLEPSSEAYLANVAFDLELTPRLEEALNNGVPLIFVVEFELTRPRWYWFDEKTTATRLESRLSYNPLLRQYRVSNGPLQRNYSALADAVAALEEVRGWPVIERDRLQPDNYVASVRMRLDTAQLPKPFLLTVITDRDWSVASAWKRMPFRPGESERVAR